MMKKLFYKKILLAVLLLELAACSSIRRYVQTDPLTPQEHVALAESYQSQGMTSLSSRELQTALRQKRDYIPALIGLGDLAFEEGKYPYAEDCFRRVLKT